MSTVTTVLLTTDINERGMKWVQEWLEEQEFAHLCVVNRYAGGNKVPQMDVWLGAYNCFENKLFTDMIRSLAWEHPHSVQLFLHGEYDDKFYGAYGHFASWYGRHFEGAPSSELEEVEGAGV